MFYFPGEKMSSEKIFLLVFLLVDSCERAVNKSFYNQRFVAVFHVYALLKTVRSAKQLAEFWTKVNSSNVVRL